MKYILKLMYKGRNGFRWNFEESYLNNQNVRLSCFPTSALLVPNIGTIGILGRMTLW